MIRGHIANIPVDGWLPFISITCERWRRFGWLERVSKRIEFRALPAGVRWFVEWRRVWVWSVRRKADA